jgi:GT2 family glycosyltransferase
MSVNISVVIPTYRRPALLKSCLEALSQQSMDKNEFDIVVVSDGPDESTAALVNSFNTGNPEIHFYALHVKKGPAAARNLGWKHAAGALIAFTDDDCLPDKDWLQHAWNNYHHEKEIVYSGRLIVPVSQRPTDHEANTANLETAEFITANCFCSRQALVRSGGFDERYGLAWREDSDLQFQFINLGIPIIKLPEAKVLHPVRQAPWGFSMKEQKKGLYNALLYKKFPGLYRKKIQPAPAWNYYIMILSITISVLAFLFEKNMTAVVALFVWLLLMVQFIIKRLHNRSHRLTHIAEMMLTSLFIPFLSVYWQLYGAVKFRVWLM